ncbi:MAG: MerR family transcriptional regulator [Thermodesulfobacteriota bacterium]|nr:MerR family transcriptional regulator [Thermodesulfobacteriota bacterium]
MSANEFITISDLAKELGVDDSRVRFYLGRFAQYLPDMADKHRETYHKDIITDLMFITEKMHSGHLLSEIEQRLHQKKKSPLKPDGAHSGTEKEPLNFLAPFLEKIVVQQERIASAHEQRAETEARKARAIEKRADAESRKAAAMNNIASALQHMKHEVFPGSPAGSLISAAQKAIAHEHIQDQKFEEKYDVSENRGGDDMDDLSLLIDDAADEPARDHQENMDDLSLLIDDGAGHTDVPPRRFKTSVTPENDFKKYKSEIINHIITLKKEGLSIEDTTALFNKEKVKTLSGKDQWSRKAIAKIFTLIDSVNKKN